MYDGGYRPDRGFSKCSRIVGDVMGQYHPHGDIGDLRHPGAARPAVGAALPAGAGPGQLRVSGQRRRCRHAVHRGPHGAAGHGDGARHRRGHRRLRTELRRPHRRSRPSCRAGSRTCWSTAAPASPSAWRPTSRRTTCARWRPASSGRSQHPDATREELLEALLERVKGPDFPTGSLIVGQSRHRRRLPHRSRPDHHARGRRGRGDPEPHLPGRSRSCRTRSTPTTSR